MLNNRSKDQEIMDDLSLGGEAMDRTLEELEVINKRLGGNKVIRDGIKKIYKTIRPDFPKAYFENNPLTIADLGCGGGDLMIVMAKWARKNNIKLRIIGVDANQNIIDFARKNCKDYPEIDFLCMDVFADEFKVYNFDIITCSFFCHHFEDDQLIRLLKQLYEQSNHAILINDLHRHWLAYYSIKMLTKFFSRSYLVKNDAALSVARAFRKKELQRLLYEAHIINYTIKWRWAFRYQIIIYENKY